MTGRLQSPGRDGLGRLAPLALLIVWAWHGFAMAEARGIAGPTGGSDTVHPYHTSTAEARVNPETNRLEVAMRVDPNDLATALSRMTKTRIPTKELDLHEREAARYLTKTFFVEAPEGEDPARLNWVGMEINITSAWLYFDLPLPESGLVGARVTHRLFYEVQRDQINTVRFRQGERRVSLQFNREVPGHRLPFTAEDGDDSCR